MMFRCFLSFDFVSELFFRHDVSTHDALQLLSIPPKESTNVKIYHYQARSISFTNEIKLIWHTRRSIYEHFLSFSPPAIMKPFLKRFKHFVPTIARKKKKKEVDPWKISAIESLLNDIESVSRGTGAA